ncbi:GNAT family N-acetyltransferase [Corynebacterium testudinoris]|uniref:Putative acyltransferase n=1 Tax=Corynebacterium testudinoris TaxID=136857 RepID=A0A0G3HF82_9CORY|nr:GNAT family N-acetyltransferase [Corynebacterium testudinoris]AKK09792.1 putative acyltransferase [Corynebacterium testudinoris]MBX8996721.1 GNAT family N-acetyltransferase [Corynebacterium testudinoris]
MTIYFAVSHLADMAPLEVHQMYKLRVDTFVHEQQCPYAEIDDIDAAPDTFHLQVWKNGDTPRTLVGTARLYPALIDGADTMKFGRFCLHPSVRGTGLSAELMEQSLRLAREQAPGLPVVLDAQLPLVDFYRGFGFEPVGETFDDEGIPHQRMRLTRS